MIDDQSVIAKETSDFLMMPRSRKRLGEAIAILSAVALILLAGCSSSTTNTKSDSTSKNGHHATVNELVQVGTTWQMTLTSAQASQGTSDEQPEGGDAFLICAFRIVNATGQSQSLYTVTTFTLTDASGRLYTPLPLSFAAPPGGSVAAHGTTSGDVSFEVPQAQTRFTLTFSSSAGQGYWDITIGSSP
jgi:hypothetical protein